MGLPVLIMLLCGLRRGEMLALKWQDINLKTKTLKVHEAVYYTKNQPGTKDPKSKAGERTIPIPDQLVDVMRKYKRSSMMVCPAASGAMMSHSAYVKAWKSYMHFLNLKAGGRDKSRSNPKVQAFQEFTAHQLRHDYATALYDSGVDMLTAQALLGHADPQITMKIYTHLSETRKTKSIDALNTHINNYLIL